MVFTRIKKLAVILGVTLGGIAHAKPNMLIDALPAGMIFPNAVGILFPGFNIAGGVNPAALPTAASKTTAVQAMYSPPLSTGGEQALFTSIASSNATSGVSAGLIGNYDTLSNRITGGYFAGAGFKIDRVSLGISVRNSDVSVNNNPEVDIGFLFTPRKVGPAFGFVLYHTNSSAQLDFGLGFKSERKFAIEINFLFPEFDEWGLSQFRYSTMFSATVYSGSFGFYLRTLSSTETFATVGVLTQISDNFSLTLQYTNPNTLNGGFTFSF